MTFETDPSYTPFKGAIDEVRIWNVARTDADIQHDYERILQGNETGLVGYWRFEETEGEVYKNTADRTNDGIANLAATLNIDSNAGLPNGAISDSHTRT